jgi:hypothetical protein
MGLFYRWERYLLQFAGRSFPVSGRCETKPKRIPVAKSELKGMARTGLEKTEAEDLLDWLEANGYRHYELASITDNSFSVSWSN